MFDILRNPYLDYETLALRQYLLGGKNMLEKSSSLSWSEWLRRRETDGNEVQQKVAGIVRKPV